MKQGKLKIDKKLKKSKISKSSEKRNPHIVQVVSESDEEEGYEPIIVLDKPKIPFVPKIFPPEIVTDRPSPIKDTLRNELPDFPDMSSINYETLPNIEPPNKEIQKMEALINQHEKTIGDQENKLKALKKEIDQKNQENSKLKESLELTINLALRMSNYLDSKALIQTESTTSILREAQILGKSIKNDKKIQKINAAIEKAVLCSYCEKNLGEVVLSCSHIYCKECVFNMLHEGTRGLFFLTTYEKENLAACCRACNKSIEEDDLKNILNIDNWEKWQKCRKERQIEQENNLESSRLCLKCNIKKDKALFYHRDPCKHMCKECILEFISEGKIRCICSKRFSFIQVARQETGVCDGCHQELSYVFDYLSTLCDGHKHCKKCMTEVYESNMSCKICQKQLNGVSFEKLMGVVQRHCEACRQNYEKDYFVKKPCCDANICLVCQSQKKNNKLCMHCNSELDGSVDKQIKGIIKLKENMNDAIKVLEKE